VEARIALLPRMDLRMLVGGIVITNDVDILFSRNVTGNVTQEIEPLLMPMPIHALADDLTARYVHGGKERCHTVALVVMSHGLTPTLLERKPRLSPVKRLDLALLVTGQYDRMLWRREVEAYNIFKLLFKVLIIGKFKAFDSMRLQSGSVPEIVKIGWWLVGPMHQHGGV